MQQHRAAQKFHRVELFTQGWNLEALHFQCVQFGMQPALMFADEGK